MMDEFRALDQQLDRYLARFAEQKPSLLEILRRSCCLPAFDEVAAGAELERSAIFLAVSLWNKVPRKRTMAQVRGKYQELEREYGQGQSLFVIHKMNEWLDQKPRGAPEHKSAVVTTVAGLALTWRNHTGRQPTGPAWDEIGIRGRYNPDGSFPEFVTEFLVAVEPRLGHSPGTVRKRITEARAWSPERFVTNRDQ